MVLLGRNCSQGKLKLIYLMMSLQAAMIVKSLPKYMYDFFRSFFTLSYSSSILDDLHM